MKQSLIKIAVYVACALFWLVSILSLIFSFIDPIKYISTISSIAYLLILIYCKWGWKICIGKLRLSPIPNLNGEWNVTIKYTNDEGQSAEKTCFARIRQDLFGIQVNLKTNEITSHSVCAELIKDHEIQYLYYVYVTDPISKYRKNNPSQFGTAKIEIPETGLERLEKIDHSADKTDFTMEGDYWTNAQTKGRLIFDKIKHKNRYSFNQKH